MYGPLQLLRMLPADQTEFGKLAAALNDVGDMVDHYNLSLTLPVLPQSLLRADEAVGNVASGFNTASAALVVAIDNLSTWHDVVVGGSVPVYASYSLARPAY